MKKSYVIDANAILDLLHGGHGAQRVKQLLTEALNTGTNILMSVLNLGEVLYVVWRESGEDTARKAISSLSGLPIQLVPVDLAQSFQAGELKARYKIPYVDCIAAALAIQRQASLVTSDRDFEKLGGRVRILWLARH